jgi:hypothetical protein
MAQYGAGSFVPPAPASAASSQPQQQQPAAAAAVGQAPITTMEAYTQLQRKHRLAQDQRRQAAAQALRELNDTTDRTVGQMVARSADRHSATQLVADEKKVDECIRDLHQQSIAAQQKLAQWGQLFVVFQSALKDIGDLSNWSAAVESDVKDAVTILSTVVKEKAKVVGAGQ